jgi:CRP-like cAMP-binding protein
VLLGAADTPIYQRIARKALHMHELGLSNTAIAMYLGVSDKTVTKAIEWIISAGPEAVRGRMVDRLS